MNHRKRCFRWQSVYHPGAEGLIHYSLLVKGDRPHVQGSGKFANEGNGAEVPEHECVRVKIENHLKVKIIESDRDWPSAGDTLSIG